MKKLYFSVIVLLYAFIAGCVVQSVTPYYSEESKIELPELDGKWKLIQIENENVSQEKINLWSIDETEMLIYDRKNVPAVLHIEFFKIGDMIYCDLYPESHHEKQVLNEYWLFHLFPVHLICKVEIQDKLLILKPIHYDWVLTQMDENQADLPHLKFSTDYEIILFTASSQHWQKFLSQYSQDEAAWLKNDFVVLEKQE